MVHHNTVQLEVVAMEKGGLIFTLPGQCGTNVKWMHLILCTVSAFVFCVRSSLGYGVANKLGILMASDWCFFQWEAANRQSCGSQPHPPVPPKPHWLQTLPVRKFL